MSVWPVSSMRQIFCYTRYTYFVGKKLLRHLKYKFLYGLHVCEGVEVCYSGVYIRVCDVAQSSVLRNLYSAILPIRYAAPNWSSVSNIWPYDLLIHQDFIGKG